MKKIKVSIIGSCVTRDAVDLILDEVDIEYYIARSSLCCMFDDSLLCAEDSLFFVKNGTNFSTKMVLNDVKKINKTLISSGGEDYVIIDLIDERFNILSYGKSLVTESSYFINTEYYHSFVYDNRISNLDEKFEMWKQGFNFLLQAVKAKNIILHKTYWANKHLNHDTGDIIYFSSDELLFIKRNNEYLNRCYDYIESVCSNLFTIKPDENLLYSDFNHKWGKAYFHFGEKYYRSIAENIISIIKL